MFSFILPEFLISLKYVNVAVLIVFLLTVQAITSSIILLTSSKVPIIIKLSLFSIYLYITVFLWHDRV
jgi:hypothetical protein